MPHTLSKSRILGYLQCPKRLYLEVHHRELMQYSASSEVAFTIGNEVGAVAQEVLMPGGILIAYDRGLRKAVASTEKYMGELFDTTLYEATFQTQNIQVRADLLSRRQNFIDVVEVKSSTSVKDLHHVDCAIQYWVMAQAGFAPSKISLAHINNEFVYQGDGNYARLFEVVDLTEQVAEHSEQVYAWVEEANETINGDLPHVDVGDHCFQPYECPFIDHCWKNVATVEYPIAQFPGLKKQQKNAIIQAGYEDVREVPAGFIDDENLLARLNAYKSGNQIIPRALQDELNALAYPRYYVDFETIGFAVPIWKDTRPYEQLPFQWSCHVEHDAGALEHSEFLDTSGEPPMRAFCESLIRAVDESGPVCVYSHYERTILKKLQQRFPDLEDALQAIIERLYDLLLPIKKYYFHRDLQGSYSIKTVLPSVVPELSYDDLEEVQDGMMAQQAYLEVIHAETEHERRWALTESLLKYCELDTYAMVKLVEKLSE